MVSLSNHEREGVNELLVLRQAQDERDYAPGKAQGERIGSRADHGTSLPSTTDVSRWRAGMSQYVRRSASPSGRRRKPCFS